MTPQKFISDIRQLIAQDQLSPALRQLHALLENSPHLDEVIQQSRRLQAIRKQIRLGTVSHEAANLTDNQIGAGLLELLDILEEQGQDLTIREEMEQHTDRLTIIQNADNIYNIGKIDNANFS